MAREGVFDALGPDTVLSRRLTVTETHLLLASALFADSVPLHVDQVTGSQSMYGSRIAPGPIVAGMAAVTLGMSLDGAAIAYMEQRERFRGAVLPGDTVTIEWRVARKEAKERFKGGLVFFEGSCTNQRNEVVMELEGTSIVSNRPDDVKERS
jgi:3-hydroxybutyryl-CoA dehydratase